MAKAVGFGLAGFGTIGTGVVKLVQQNAALIERRLGFPLQLARVADLDTQRNRGVTLGGAAFGADAGALLADPRVQIVVELIGGDGFAKQFVLDALARGKPVVTANKALLARHGEQIFAAAAAAETDVLFEAAVGGGIPVLRALREGLAADQIVEVRGILNGTTNAILSQMAATGEALAPVLKRAQQRGLAEADPRFDVEGIDAAHKLALLAAMAFGAHVDYAQIPTEGINAITPADFQAAAELGYRIKLLGVAKLHRDSTGAPKLEARVHPAMLPARNLLAQVDGEMNAIAITGAAAGTTLYYGAGAGELPTAGAVLADVMELARGIGRGGAGFVGGRVAPLSTLPQHRRQLALQAPGESRARRYLAFRTAGKPGTLARIKAALEGEGVGVAKVLQNRAAAAAAGAGAPLALLTHAAADAAVQRALALVSQMPDAALAPPRCLRMEEAAAE